MRPHLDYFLLLLPVLCHRASPAHSAALVNLCASAGLCCRHRDSACVVQRDVDVFANNSVDTSELPCYCDRACIKLEDCCPDYKEFCSVRNCVVSEWGPWSPCPINDDADKDCSNEDEKAFEDATTERHRVVLHHPENGGAKCPELTQRKQCSSSSVQVKCGKSDHIETPGEHLGKSSEGEAASETSTHQIAKSQPEKDEAEDASELRCVKMVVERASHGCQKHRIQTGTPICIQCNHDSKSSISQSSLGKLLGLRRTNRGLDHRRGCPQLANASQEDETEGQAERRFRLDRHCHGKLKREGGRDGLTTLACSECQEKGILQFRVET